MKTIPLTQGAAAIVDDQDYDKLIKHSWHLNKKHEGTKFYAYRKQWIKKDGRYINLAMHRVITSCPKNMEVDHINGNGLDNRRKNLRVVTHAENMQNMVRRKTNKSGYPGVSWDTQTKKWRASITRKNKFHDLGRHEEMADAIKARERAEKEFAKTKEENN